MIEPHIAALADAIAAAEERERTEDDIIQAIRIYKHVFRFGFILTEV